MFAIFLLGMFIVCILASDFVEDKLAHIHAYTPIARKLAYLHVILNCLTFMIVFCAIIFIMQN